MTTSSHARPPFGSRLRLIVGCAGLALLSACASGGHHVAQAPTTSFYLNHAAHDYTPPGPPSDPWGPYVKEASAHFDVPQSWIRQVMRVESGGHEYINGHLTVSSVGAMGLMQLMPGTYQEMASRYGLGSDPFNPYDNIMAGTAYIHEMYQIYGSPGFLAAYDAGPGRLNSFVNRDVPLPRETVNYVAMIAPHIQGAYPVNRSPADELALNTQPMGEGTGILPAGFVPSAPAPSQFGTFSPGPVRVASIAPTLPSAPPPAPPPPAPVHMSVVASERKLPPPVHAPSVVQSPKPVMVASNDPVSALPLPPPEQKTAKTTGDRSFSLIPPAMADTPSPTSQPATAGHHGWAIQVGAYSSSSGARAALGIAELSAVQMLVNGHAIVMSIHSGGAVKYRARVVGLQHEDAIDACDRLAKGPTGCVVLSPEAQS